MDHEGRRSPGRPPAEGAADQVVDDLPLRAIAELVRSIRFGTVVIVVQDGRVVQLDKTEKIRLT